MRLVGREANGSCEASRRVPRLSPRSTVTVSRETEAVAKPGLQAVGGWNNNELVGNGLPSTLLRHPEDLKRLQEDFSLIPVAIEELLRYESPSNIPPDSCLKTSRAGRQASHGKIRRPRRAGRGQFEPSALLRSDHLDIARSDNRHLAFGWTAHHCFALLLPASKARWRSRPSSGACPVRLRPAPIARRPNLDCGVSRSSTSSSDDRLGPCIAIASKTRSVGGAATGPRPSRPAVIGPRKAARRRATLPVVD